MNAQGREHLPPEVLAAFLDGNLRDGERSRVLEHLASCEDCYEVFSDTAHLLEETEDEELESDPAPEAAAKILRPQRFRWRTVVLWTPLAVAALLALLLVPWRGVGTLPVADLTAELASDAGLDAVSSTRDTHWPVARGGELGLTDQEQAAFRLGVRAVELEVALAAGDRDLARYLAAQIGAGLPAIPLSEPVQVVYTGSEGISVRLDAGEPPRQLLPLHREADRLLGPDSDSGEPGFADPFWYRFGKWAGAAQLAALTGHGEWFEQTRSRRLLRELRGREMPAPLEERLDRLARELEADPAERDLAAIASVLGDVIRIAGAG